MLIIIWNSLDLRIIQQDFISFRCFSWELPAIFFPILTKFWIFSAGYSKNPKRKISSESVQWDPICSLPSRDERRGRQKYMMKLKVAFRKFTKSQIFLMILRDKSSQFPCNDHSVNSKYHAILCEIETQSPNRGVASLTGTAKVGHPLG